MTEQEIKKEYARLVEFMAEKFPAHDLFGVHLEGSKLMILFSAN